MKKLALLFPGQGSQYVGMGKALCSKYPIAQQIFEQANQALGFDLQKLCFEGDLKELTKTENTQPAILTVGVAAFKVFMQELKVIPQFMAGHSLGEITALTCAGAIHFTDAVKLVRQRAQYMQEAVPIGVGAMAAVSGPDQETIETECRNYSTEENFVAISNYNSSDQIVISGHIKAVNHIGDKLTQMGAKVIPLKVSAPFHSPLMQPAANHFGDELNNYLFSDLVCPVISNVNALPYKNKQEIIPNLTLQIVKPVQWQSSIEYLRSQGIGLVIEMGPQSVLKKLVKRITPKIEAYSYDDENDIKTLKTIIEPDSFTINKQKKDEPTVVTRCLAIAVCTRNRNWNNEEYQKGVIEPYQKIQRMQEELEKEKRKPSSEQMYQALEMLRSVFDTKKVPLDEQIARFNQIFEETKTREVLSDFKMPNT
jgi:[acyl-carrier-protein] S-malonyltransferase